LKRAAYLGHDAAPLFEFLSSLPEILALVFKALKPGGLHFASYKGGGAERRDRYGRYHQRRIAAAGETVEQYNAKAAQGTMPGAKLVRSRR
jgi:hypothetical protein